MKMPQKGRRVSRSPCLFGAQPWYHWNENNQFAKKQER